VRPQACNVPLGSKFDLLVSILGAPIEGYQLFQTFISFGESLLYDIDQTTQQEEVLWPGCGAGVRFQLDENSVGHGCLTGLIPPLPSSTYVGPFIQLSMVCSETPTSSELLLLQDEHPSTGTSGTVFVLSGPGADKLLAEVSPLTINCVDIAPAAVGGVALGGELRDVTAQDGRALWLWAALGVGAIVALSGLVYAGIAVVADRTRR